MTKPKKNDCAPSEDSDQPGHQFLFRLTSVSAGRTDQFVGFVMRRLK